MSTVSCRFTLTVRAVSVLTVSCRFMLTACALLSLYTKVSCHSVCVSDKFKILISVFEPQTSMLVPCWLSQQVLVEAGAYSYS